MILKRAMVGALLWSAAVAAQLKPVPSDSAIWSDVFFSKKVHERISINAWGSLRFGHNVSGLSEEHTSLGISYELSHYLTVGTAYRFGGSQWDPARHTLEHRVMLEATPHLPLGAGFSLNDRNRIEARVVNGVLSERYRNRIQLERAMKLFDHRATPYLAFEDLFDTHYHQWSRKRYGLGVRVSLQRHLSLETSYARQNDRRSTPGNTNIVTCAFRFEY